MLSICIPIYNTKVTQLVADLHAQAEKLTEPAEILLIDDASEPAVEQANKSVRDWPLVRYEVLPKNIGRSKIRNLLALKARYPLLLFMDCDLGILSGDFLQKYLDAGRDGSLVCGGHVYHSQKPPHEYVLHWTYGKQRESQSAAVRSLQPYHAFMTSCVLIPAHIMHMLPFNEEIKGYGHEDTLYGYQLMKRGLPIKHIDNPVLHAGLVPASQFLEKTHQAIRNLKMVWHLTGHDKDFIGMVKLLKTHKKLAGYKLDRLVAWLFAVTAPGLRKALLGRNPRLLLLDVYKLGYLSRLR